MARAWRVQEQALHAHVRLLRKNASIAFASGLPFELHYDGNVQTPFFSALVRSLGVVPVPQVEGDIGARMLAAARWADAPSLIIGSDCGGLSVRYLHEAAAALATSDIVLGPAEDGGYVLIGQRHPVAALFSNVDWGTDRVLRQTRETALRAGLSVTELTLQWDVDNINDWRRYQNTTLTPDSDPMNDD